METPIKTDTFALEGVEFTAHFYPDYDLDWPWIEYDGYGAVREKPRHYKKAPHEIIINDSHIYDVKATIKKAKAEGWGIAKPPAEWTKKQIIAEAIKRDIKTVRKWLNGDAFWVTCEVKSGDCAEYLGGIAVEDYDFDDAVKYHASGLAHQILTQKRAAWRKALTEARARRYWASRDVVTV